MRETEDRWHLELRGQRVSNLTIGGYLEIQLESGPTVTVCRNAVLTHGPLTAPGAVPKNVSELSIDEIERFIAGEILSAVAFKTGSLRIIFSTGYHLNLRTSDMGSSGRIDWPGSFTLLLDGSATSIRRHE